MHLEYGLISILPSLPKVNVMYQTALRQFLVLFDGSITKSKPTHIIDKRINNILEYLTKIVWRYTLRGLYEKHKFLFTLLLGKHAVINIYTYILVT